MDWKKHKIVYIDYINKESDLKPVCDRCLYRNHVWNIDDEYICEDCLTKDEIKMILDKHNFNK